MNNLNYFVGEGCEKAERKFTDSSARATKVVSDADIKNIISIENQDGFGSTFRDKTKGIGICIGEQGERKSYRGKWRKLTPEEEAYIKANYEDGGSDHWVKKQTSDNPSIPFPNSLSNYLTAPVGTGGRRRTRRHRRNKSRKSRKSCKRYAKK
jgi:hypothetical protein